MESSQKMMAGENDQAGRPPVPWDQWTTHCRIIRAQEHRVVACVHPVEYRGLTFYQCCPDECPVVNRYSTGKERKSAK